MQQLTFRAMGCQILAVVDDDRANAAHALACVPHWFEVWEQHLSRFRPDSELSELNRDGYAPAASPVLWEVVQLALAQARQTEGLITPTLLEALEAAGYDRSFEALQACDDMTTRNIEPSPSTMGSALEHIHCDPTTRSIRLSAGVRLDLGGCAKGWAVDVAVQRLAAYGPVLVDAGGDIAVSGPPVDGSPWPIGVANPRACSEQSEQLDLVLLAHGGIATSGREYRRWRRNGTWQHHLIDPRTLEPAITDVLSATVIGPCAVDCEVAAKVVLLRGSHDGLRWLEARPEFAGLAVLQNGSVLRSSRLEPYRWQAA